MKNIQVIKNFLNGETKGKTANLRIEGNSLINYSTVIAKNLNGKIYLNNTKYSQTTSTIQNVIRRLSPALIEVTAEQINNINILEKIA